MQRLVIRPAMESNKMGENFKLFMPRQKRIRI